MNEQATKVCTGPAHPGPVRLPVTTEHWYFHKSGERVGRPTSRCKICINWPRRGKHKTVECKSVRPFIKELVDRCGGRIGAARYTGIPIATVNNVLGERNCRIKKETAAKILTALAQRRREDRRDRTVDQRFHRARVQQALIEERMERLAGY